jgi:hypothetical protein
MNVDGSILLTGGTPPAPSGGGGGGGGVIGSSTDNPLAASTNTVFGQPNTNGLTVGTAGGTPPAPTNSATAASTNAPASASTATNIAQQTAALYNGQTIDTQGIIAAIQTADRNNQAGLEGVSNAVGSGATAVTNGLALDRGFLASISNSVSQINSNGIFSTNGLEAAFPSLIGQMSNNVGPLSSGGAMLSNAAAAMTNYTIGTPSDGVTINFDCNPGTGSVQTAWSMTLSLAAVQAVQSLVPYRAAIAWVIWICTLFEMLAHAEKMVFRILNQRQIQGSKQEAFGANIDWFTALVYAGVIASLVASIPTALGAWFSTANGTIASLVNNLTTVSSTPAWGWVTALVPVDVILTAFFSYVTFRFVVCDFLMSFIAAVIMILVC